MSITAPTISVAKLSPMRGYCAASGAMTAASNGANATVMTASHGSLRYHGGDFPSETDGSARDSGARLGSACGSPSEGREPLGNGVGCGSGRTKGVVMGFEATVAGIFGAGIGRE